jgi:hypothetical protein
MKNMSNKTGYSKASVLSIILLTSLSVGACGTMRGLSGLDKNTPDEFRVLSKAPLVMPPDYNLRPPRAGEPAPQQLSPSTQAINALFPGHVTLPPAASASEVALTRKIGSQSVSPNIRSTVSGDDTIVVEKGSLLRDILTSGEVIGSPDGSKLSRSTSEN